MTRFARASVCCFVLLLIAGVAMATRMEPVAGMSALDARLKRLESELRCLVCQNQTLADSNASLAEDLRNEVRELAVAGRSDDEIRAYLVARYGDFVLYDPPLKRTTLFLWLGPFVLLIAGGSLWWTVQRRRARGIAGTDALPDSAAEARARERLDAKDEDDR